LYNSIQSGESESLSDITSEFFEHTSFITTCAWLITMLSVKTIIRKILCVKFRFKKMDLIVIYFLPKLQKKIVQLYIKDKKAL